MSEETERLSSKKKFQELETKINELETSVKALLKGMVKAEDEVGEPLMPQGVFHGYDFND